MDLSQEQKVLLQIAGASCIASKSKEELERMLSDYGELLSDSKRYLIRAMLDGDIELAREYATPF